MNVTIETTKVCKKCGEDKPLSEYYKRKSSKDGHYNQCKACAKAAAKEYRERVAAERVEPAPTYTKTCTKCGEDKPLSEYHKNGKGGLRSDCKVCVRSAVKDYRVINSEKVKVASKAWREANREELAAYFKAYHEANREKRNAAKKAYYEANHEELTAVARAYYEANHKERRAAQKAYHAERWANDPEYRAQCYANKLRRQRMLASAVQEPYTREEIFARDNWTCGLCQEPIDPELRHPESGSASIDHIVPVSHGGDDTPANVQAAHFGCNSAKGNRVELEELQAA